MITTLNGSRGTAGYAALFKNETVGGTRYWQEYPAGFGNPSLFVSRSRLAQELVKGLLTDDSIGPWLEKSSVTIFRY